VWGAPTLAAQTLHSSPGSWMQPAGVQSMVLQADQFGDVRWIDPNFHSPANRTLARRPSSESGSVVVQAEADGAELI
jgi:hypothetical protein